MKAKNNWLHIFQGRIDRMHAIEPTWYILLPGIILFAGAVVLLIAILLDKI